MSIVTISRGCFSHGSLIARRVAEILGYECVSREILIEASRFFDIPERTLLKSIHDAPTILDRITQGKEKYLSYISAALLDKVRMDNVVYHGHAGHFLLREFPKVLKVRINADWKDRIAMLMEEKGCSKSQATEYIRKDDMERNNWTRYLYKKDVDDPEFYDMVLRVGKLTIEKAARLIARAAETDAFKLNDSDREEINDMAVETMLRVLLADIVEAEVQSKNGWVHIRCKSPKIKKFDPIRPQLAAHLDDALRDDLNRQINDIVSRVSGIKGVDCDVLPFNFL